VKIFKKIILWKLRVITHPLLIYRFSDVLYFFIYYILRFRNKVVYTNLNNAFPEKPSKEIRKIAKQFYKNLCDLVFETLELICDDGRRLSKKLFIEEETTKIVKDSYDKTRNILILNGHIFNWEVMAFFPKSTDYKVLISYKQLNNERINSIMKNAREKFGGIAVDFKKMYRTIKEYDALGKPTLTWIAADQRPGGNTKIINLRFLNQETKFYDGLDALAKKTNQSVYFEHMTRLGRGKYMASARLITENPKEEKENFIIETYAKMLEDLIRKDPANWLWGHKRWK